ncbi:MAG: ABC transporter substrate-binding protein [Pygmaiobacter massiliensis]|nr:ABC transporter substrate-binding protein [Pygmaiobacter massiliensis]
MKRWIALILCLIMATTLFSCAQNEKKDDGSTSSVQQVSSTAGPALATFEDALGNIVAMGQSCVGSGQGSLAEAWLLAGGQIAAVTDDAFSERDLDLPEDVVVLGGTKEPSAELAIEAGVDFMLLSADVPQHVELAQTLEAAGVTCAFFDMETFDDYLDVLWIMTEMTGRKDLYEQNGLAIQEQVDAAIARSEGQEQPTVLLLRAYSTGVKAKGSDNMAGAMLADLGCINLADQDDSLLEELSVEKIIEADPDYIFVVTMGASSEAAMESVEQLLTSNPAWSGLSAVKNDRYVVLPKDLFHYKPNARWGESYEMLADILYPDT